MALTLLTVFVEVIFGVNISLTKGTSGMRLLFVEFFCYRMPDLQWLTLPTNDREKVRHHPSLQPLSEQEISKVEGIQQMVSLEKIVCGSDH